MTSINLSDLPEPVARAIAEMVDTVRRQLAVKPPETAPPRPTLSVWPGTVLGELRREDIYDDVG